MNIKFGKMLNIAVGVLSIVTPLLCDAKNKQELNEMVQKEVAKALSEKK